MKTRLNDTTIRQISPPSRGSKVTYDTETRGFGICVTKAGTRSFVLNYRTRAGRERRVVIGQYPDWTTVAARTEAQRLRVLINQGGDPLTGIEADRAAPTMGELIERFMAEHAKPHLAFDTVRSYRSLIKKHIGSHFGAHAKVADVSFEDIDALHRKITATGAGYAANRAVALLSKMFSLAVRWRMRPDNPVKGIRHNAEASRKRYLKPDEMGRLIDALAAHPDRKAANILRVLMMTGARSHEVMAMRWADLDLTAGVWSKPGSTTKQRTDHVVPLSAPVRQLLSEIEQSGDFVFPGDGVTRHMRDIGRSWKTIKAAAKITDDLRIHDLRHSFASQLVSGGASLQLIGALLGHSNPKTTNRYSHMYDDPQRAAVERVAAAMSGKPLAEVDEIKGGRRG